jgi:hypothetical protein
MINIKFLAQKKELLEFLEKPFVAKKITPEWLKKMGSFHPSDIKVDEMGDPLTTVKKCMPFNDARTAGYFIPLPCDVYVERKPQLHIKWSSDQIELIGTHQNWQFEEYPVPKGYETEVAFKWLNPWIIKTPKNWSCLYTHPIHFDELPFQSLTGLVDTDKFPYPVNFPFFLKNDFEGLIPKGTPFIQVIPFKREKFISTYSYDDGRYQKLWLKARTVFFDRYKKFFRTPKEFLEGEIEKPKCPFAFLHSKKD